MTLKKTTGKDMPGEAGGRLKIGDNWNAISILRLYMKEPVLADFPKANREELAARMVELIHYYEEHLR